MTAGQIEAGYKTLIAEAHAKGVKIYAGTLMPFMGSNSVYGGYFGTAYGEQLREQVNTWIETSHAFDGVINFAKIMADPYQLAVHQPGVRSQLRVGQHGRRPAPE